MEQNDPGSEDARVAATLPDPARRRLLQTVATGAALSALRPWSAWSTSSAVLINDVTGLNPTWVDQQRAPRTAGDVCQAIVQWPGPISIGGARYSMGGQIAAEHSLHLDMRQFNRVVRYDAAAKVVRVQTGMRWRDLQTVIDPDDLSVKIMQSYANFTVGGALSVNALRRRGSGNQLGACDSAGACRWLAGGGLTHEQRRSVPCRNRWLWSDRCHH